MIERAISTKIKEKTHKGKAIILVGARQVGKSTLLKQLFKGELDVLWLDAESPDVVTIFENTTETRLRALFGKSKVVVIDEAQKVPHIGSKIKLCVDYIKEVQIIATGSSSFELQNQTNEPLTGRKWEFQLFPISFAEMVHHTSLLEEKRQLPHRLVWGYYPELVTQTDDLAERLKTLTDSYLYKDILVWQGIQKPEKLIHLMKALALQVGAEVNYNELGNLVGLKNDTVEKYIQILEQAFVIFRLPAYSSNQRKELKKARKIYFFDNGVRNAIINDFKHWELRSDKGALWENFVISELWKKEAYARSYAQFYFWRTQDQQELDLLIQKGDLLETYEIKLNSNAKIKRSKLFERYYPNSTFQVIHTDNVEDFLGE